MPYEIRKNGDEWCVYKKTGGESLGCFDSRAGAQRQIAAIYASEGSKSLDGTAHIQKSDGDSGLRLMVIRTSNAYRDREGEIVSQKALQGYVESCWKNQTFVGTNPLLLWHGGDPVGDIIFADMIGPFLVEVARERPNAVINVALDGEPLLETTVKAVWDALEQESDLGASHEFYYNTSDREDRVYEQILKTETSVLPRWAAANLMTDSEVIRRPENG